MLPLSRLIRPLLLLAAAVALPLFTPAATAPASSPAYVEGEVIVTFKEGASLARAEAVLKNRSAAFSRRFDGLSEKRRRQTGLVRDTTRSTAALIAALRDDPAVESVEPNYLRHVRTAPNDPRFGEQWALRNTGQTVNGSAGVAFADIDFLDARALSRPATSEIVVAVIDTGVDRVHPDLRANLWTNPSEIAGNSLDDDGDGYVDDTQGYDFASHDADATDAGEHGTHVAGIIAAVGDNQTGVIGVVPSARILPLKVSTDGETLSTSAIIEALQYATALRKRGVNLVAINASYGGGGYSSAEAAAIQAAGDAGILFCAAAGNEAANNDSTLTYPASYRLSNMLVVAATTQSDTLASFSNYGATSVDLAAPGQDILSAQPSTLAFVAGSTTYASIELTYGGLTPGISGTIIDCGLGNSSEFPAAVRGNIALIQRGTLTFAAKVANAKTAGAVAAIIYNNAAGNFSGTLGSAGDWLPARSISQADGLAIKAALPLAGAITVTGNYQFLSGTSMATPVVAGAAAFAALNFPDETVARRRARLLASVAPLPALSGKVATTGRLDLLRVVDANLNGYADWLETTPAVATTSLPVAILGEAYSQTLSVTGGIAPYAWTVSSGALPAGFTLSASGTLAGAGTASGSHAFTVRVTDVLGATATRALTLTLAAHGPLDHFTWDYAPAGVYAGVPFAVRLSARDSGGRLVSDFAGAVSVASSSTASPASLALTAGLATSTLSLSGTASATTLVAASGSATGASAPITVLSASSSAADGVPDAWKTAHGLAINTSSAATDTDGDGATDHQEYLAGTDPRSAASTFKITTIPPASAPAVATTLGVVFPVVAGKIYQLQTSADLATWTAYGDATLALVDGTRSASVPLGAGGRTFVRAAISP